MNDKQLDVIRMLNGWGEALGEWGPAIAFALLIALLLWATARR